jgi:hypothetical protein
MKTKLKMEIQRSNNGIFDRILIFVDARKTTTY